MRCRTSPSRPAPARGPHSAGSTPPPGSATRKRRRVFPDQPPSSTTGQSRGLPPALQETRGSGEQEQSRHRHATTHTHGSCGRLCIKLWVFVHQAVGSWVSSCLRGGAGNSISSKFTRDPATTVSADEGRVYALRWQRQPKPEVKESHTFPQDPLLADGLRFQLAGLDPQLHGRRHVLDGICHHCLGLFWG